MKCSHSASTSFKSLQNALQYFFVGFYFFRSKASSQFLINGHDDLFRFLQRLESFRRHVNQKSSPISRSGMALNDTVLLQAINKARHCGIINIENLTQF